MIVSAVLVALLLGVCLFAGLPRAGRRQRAVAAASFVALIGVVYAGSIDLLGDPKPMRLEWRPLARATVLSARMNEGKAIYLWLQTAGSAAPRAYVLPWSVKMAQQLQDAMQQREESGARVRMAAPQNPRQGGGGGEARFYAEPQPPSPPKQRADDGPVVVEPPG